MSTGRGGAGNFSKERSGSFTTPEDLRTPTIKAETYTTGRGGTGNMAKNDFTNPHRARVSQDVEAPLTLLREPERSFHTGRGGAANVGRASSDDGCEGDKAKNGAGEEGKDRSKNLLEKLGAGK